MKNLKKIAVLSLVLLFTIFNSPSSSVGATLLSDSFGTGNTVNDVSGWRESENPNDNDSDVVAKQSSASSSNSDYQSPDGGRFVKIKGDNDEWFCKQINTVGYQSLVLGYYWRGEASAESDDLGIVEFRANGTSDSSCNSNENGGWTTLASHQLDNASGENNQTQEAWALNSVNIPSDEDGMFLIRFRNDSSSDSEYFRVDGVKVEGTLIPVDVCSNVDGMQDSLPSNFHFAGEGICIPNGGSSGDNNSPGPGPSSTPSPDQGQVLGATTSCGLYLETFLKYGNKNNNEEQVKKLQTFLNDYLELDPKIIVNGIFGLDTKKAVIKFQEKEFGLVLNPWKLKKGTGWVYKTTVTRINNIMCETLNIPLPEAKID